MQMNKRRSDSEDSYQAMDMIIEEEHQSRNSNSKRTKTQDRGGTRRLHHPFFQTYLVPRNSTSSSNDSNYNEFGTMSNFTFGASNNSNNSTTANNNNNSFGGTHFSGNSNNNDDDGNYFSFGASLPTDRFDFSNLQFEAIPSRGSVDTSSDYVILGCNNISK